MVLKCSFGLAVSGDLDHEEGNARKQQEVDPPGWVNDE